MNYKQYLIENYLEEDLQKFMGQRASMANHLKSAGINPSNSEKKAFNNIAGRLGIIFAKQNHVKGTSPVEFNKDVINWVAKNVKNIGIEGFSKEMDVIKNSSTKVTKDDLIQMAKNSKLPSDVLTNKTPKESSEKPPIKTYKKDAKKDSKNTTAGTKFKSVDVVTIDDLEDTFKTLSSNKVSTIGDAKEPVVDAVKSVKYTAKVVPKGTLDKVTPSKPTEDTPEEPSEDTPETGTETTSPSSEETPEVDSQETTPEVDTKEEPSTEPSIEPSIEPSEQPSKNAIVSSYNKVKEILSKYTNKKEEALKAMKPLEGSALKDLFMEWKDAVEILSADDEKVIGTSALAGMARMMNDSGEVKSNIVKLMNSIGMVFRSSDRKNIQVDDKDMANIQEIDIRKIKSTEIKSFVESLGKFVNSIEEKITLLSEEKRRLDDIRKPMSKTLKKFIGDTIEGFEPSKALWLKLDEQVRVTLSAESVRGTLDRNKARTVLAETFAALGLTEDITDDLMEAIMRYSPLSSAVTTRTIKKDTAEEPIADSYKSSSLKAYLKEQEDSSLKKLAKKAMSIFERFIGKKTSEVKSTNNSLKESLKKAIKAIS